MKKLKACANTSQDQMELFTDIIAKCCIDKYIQLPKTGKPVKSEWTVLSCVVQYHIIDKDKHVEVVSLGTGTKCIGASKMSSEGDILNDSHAEVIARRGFLIYIYENIQKASTGQQSVFTVNNGKFRLKDSLKFAFFSSQLPCGDASIHPITDSELVGDVINTNLPYKRIKQDDNTSKSMKSEETTDIHRTGAKCVVGADQDPREFGSSYHIVGQVRSKPGRGDRTLSVSCSDKIARWIHVGIQGALIDMILEEPIAISMFVFGSGVPYSENSLRRALLERNEGGKYLKPFEPKILHSSIRFPHIKSADATRPAPGSILWVKTEHPILEVAVLGMKLGTTKKTTNSPASQLSISKFNLYRYFIKTINLNNSLIEHLQLEKFSSVPYNIMKKKSTRYYQKWAELKHQFFSAWTKKGDIWNFTADFKIKKSL